MSQLHIKKLDAAKRQLEQAVHLFFNGGDPVSIHTLAWAAYDIIYHVNKHRGGMPMLVKDQLSGFVPPEKRPEFLRNLGAHRNFFKHANIDPEAELDFDPSITDMILFEACDKYRGLTGEIVPRFHLMLIWFCVNNKKLYNPPPPFEKLLNETPPEKIKLDRKKYYKAMLPFCVQQLQNTP